MVLNEIDVSFVKCSVLTRLVSLALATCRLTAFVVVVAIAQ